MTRMTSGTDKSDFDPAPDQSSMNGSSIHEALRWALEDNENSSMASADWLVRDIDPAQPSAVALLVDPHVSLRQLKHAKDAFKTMRIVGETATDRSLASRLYLGAIAAAMVRHDERITTQSDRALLRGLESMIRDENVAEPLRAIARDARRWVTQRCG